MEFCIGNTYIAEDQTVYPFMYPEQSEFHIFVGILEYVWINEQIKLAKILCAVFQYIIKNSNIKHRDLNIEYNKTNNYSSFIIRMHTYITVYQEMFYTQNRDTL